MHVAPNMYKIITLKANAKNNRYLKMHVAPHMCKTITLKANAKEIITLKCIYTKYLQNHYFTGKH